MTNKSTKKALALSIISLVVCVSMLVGTTFAWFTDSVTSANNKIIAGNLKLDLSVLETDNTTWTSVKESKDPIFNYTNWEPGYTEVKILKVSNLGSLALKWKATFKSDAPLGELANVIDVYVKPGVTTYSADRAVLDGWNKVGTLNEFANTLSETTYGQLTAKGTATAEATLGLAFKMQETAGNEYQSKELGAFDITILATQLASEKDSFDEKYDESAVYDDLVYVSDGLYKDKDNANSYSVNTAEGFESLNKLMANKTAGKNVVVNLLADIDMAGKTWTPVDSHADSAFSFAGLNGNGHTIKNLTINGQAMFTRFAGFGDVTIKNVTFDNANVNSGNLNTSILTVQSYQNVLLDNVDVVNSTIVGTYKVAPLIATVYNENPSSITCTVKNCDISNTVVTSTLFDFCTAGMIAFVYEGNNDKVEFENCTVTNVKLYAKSNGYASHAWVYVNDAATDDCFNEVNGVTVSDCTFENL